ncbi:MAG: SDR family oxidoreductase [Burkholderiales bacterium]
MNLSDARVLITGAGAGLGKEIACSLKAGGAEVHALELNAETAAALEVETSGGIRCWQCDVASPPSVAEVLGQVFASGFSPNVLINNAGIIHSEPLVNLLARGERTHSLDSWRRVITTDLESVFVVTSRVVDHMLMKRTKGVVISISSVAARGNPGQSAYSAAKAGVNALTQSWAKELGPMGMRFVSIAPGFIDTSSTRSALSEATLDRLRQSSSLKKLGTASQVATSVRYAIENDYVTGTVLEVDGGLVL